jgi:beta-galactosidase
VAFIIWELVVPYFFDVKNFSPKNKCYLKFDGAMSEARVYVNGKRGMFWLTGTMFHCDVTEV